MHILKTLYNISRGHLPPMPAGAHQSRLKFAQRFLWIETRETAATSWSLDLPVELLPLPGLKDKGGSGNGSLSAPMGSRGKVPVGDLWDVRMTKSSRS